MPSPREMEKLNQLARRQPWLKLFLTFLDRMRIDSRELVAKDDRGSRIELWNSQRMCLEQIAEGMEQDRFMFYILKGRQVGISTLTLAIFLFMVLVRPRTIGALVCNTEEIRDAFRDTLERYVLSFPANFFGDRVAKHRHNSSHFLFTHGSRIDYLVAGQRSTSWGESRGYSVCLCTEVAKYGKYEGLRSFMEALAQSNPFRWFAFESTANGMNHWHDMWTDAEDELTIKRIFLGWWSKEGNSLKRSDPRYRRFGVNPPDGEESQLCNEVYERFGHVVTMEQLAWYRWWASQSDRQTMEQNQPWTDTQAFVMSGFSFFQVRRIQDRYNEIYEQQVPFKAYRFVMGNNFWAMKLEQIMDSSRYADIELKVWEDPVKEAQYAIGCDPAGSGSGDNKNNHAIQVFRCFADKLVQVAEYADNRFQTNHCAWILAGLAGAYRNSIVNLELFGPGRVVMNEFDNIRNQLRQEVFNPMNEANDWDEEFMAGARWFMYRRVDNPGPGFVYNFETTARRKMELFQLFRDCFSTDVLLINSVKMLEEMANMVSEKADIAPAAQGRNLDDRPFAAALAVYAWNEWLRNALIGARAMYDRVMAEERGESTVAARMMDRLVYSYLGRRQEEAEEREAAGPWADEGWRGSRGLLDEWRR